MEQILQIPQKLSELPERALNKTYQTNQTNQFILKNQFRDIGKRVPTNKKRKQSPSYISSFLPNGINTENRPIVGVDWSRHEIDIYEKGKPINKFSTLAAAALHYKGYIWAIESTADSYELQNRQIDLDAIENSDIRAYCSNPKYTARYRLKWDDIAKTDEADAEVIYRIFTETKVTWSVLKQLKAEDRLRDKISHDIIMDRYLYDGQNAIDTAKRFLPSLKDVPENFRHFLYDPQSIKCKNPKNPKPRKQIGRMLIAAINVREAGLGWRTFRRQIGNYGQGYGCILRSEYYWWWIRTIFNQRLKQLGIEKQMKKSGIDPKTKEDREVRLWTAEESKILKDVMKESSQVLRYLWKLTNLTNLKT